MHGAKSLLPPGPVLRYAMFSNLTAVAAASGSLSIPSDQMFTSGSSAAQSIPGQVLVSVQSNPRGRSRMFLRVNDVVRNTKGRRVRQELSTYESFVVWRVRDDVCVGRRVRRYSPWAWENQTR